MVMASRRAVIERVRRARKNQAASDPTSTLPAAIHRVFMPKPQPSLPA